MAASFEVQTQFGGAAMPQYISNIVSPIRTVTGQDRGNGTIPFWILWLITIAAFPTSARTAEWQLCHVPHVWKSMPDRSDGTCWFRCATEIPTDWETGPIQLFVESVDDAREVYVNGQLVGSLGTFPPEYRSGLGRSERFTVPGRVIAFGQANVIAIRVHRNQSRSGFNVAAPVLFGRKRAIRLAGPWETARGDDPAWSRISARSAISPQALFTESQSADAVERMLRRLEDDAGPLDPAGSLASVTTPTDLVAEVAISEPAVQQPVSFKWDHRGRLWVSQYLQYPHPAGLRMVSRDKFLRTVYDKIPQPPPHHDVGADRITIHEDTNRDGSYDTSKTFVDGLNMATSFAIGRGGVWVLNPPYLLFYPDRNEDDVPDAAPEVHLEGFGLEDSHSLVNNLRWGPDGWLYAAQGSTVSGRVKRYGSDDSPIPSMGQLIWRYHPELRTYEVFAEGGGNAFGLEIDAKGRIFSGHNGQDTRGFHYVQGGYLRKGFGKHGQLSNPFAFGYLDAMGHHASPRFTHAFVIYEADALPARYRRKMFSVAPLQGQVIQSSLITEGSTFKTQDEGHLFKSRDPWCRPVDIQVGPDGAIYIADFYEQRIDHASHYQGRVHRESGRIYRIRASAQRALAALDANLSGDQLMQWQRHPQKWYRQTALRRIADRKDITLAPQLLATLRNETGQLALESLWALNLTSGLSDAIAIEAMQHRDPYVRLWAVRLVCDRKQASSALVAHMVKLAQEDANVEVRSQLACSARRLPTQQCLAIIHALLTRGEDVEDPYQPLLIWWAIENKATDEQLIRFFVEKEIWDLPIVKRHLLSRIMRRYAQSGRRRDLTNCVALFKAAPSEEHTRLLLGGFEQAYQGRSLQGIPNELSQAIVTAGGGSIELRLRRGEASAIEHALSQIRDVDVDAGQRVSLIGVLGELRYQPAQPILLERAQQDPRDDIRVAALAALQSFDDDEIAVSIIHIYNQLPESIQDAACATLASRPTWSRQLVHAVEQEQIAADSFPATVIASLWLHQDDDLQQRIRSIWGEIPGATTDEMRAEIERLTKLMHAGSGVPHHGKPLFIERCGKCHRLFEDGGEIGPNLTQYDRSDLRQMLANVVNPSLSLREGFESHVVVTSDGRALSGLIMDQDNQVVVLKNHQGQTQLIQRSEIEELAKSPRSLMPDDTLASLTDQQIRDLFAYLRSSQPLP